MASEGYELIWKEFEQCAAQTFKRQYNSLEFSDVTLVCEDEKQIKCHKMILSACSSFFNKILKLNPHQHPLIYLKGVKHDTLRLVLKFMYFDKAKRGLEDFPPDCPLLIDKLKQNSKFEHSGQTKVAESELKTFLEAAEELKVLGLTDTSSFKRDLGLGGSGTKPVVREKVTLQPSTVPAPQQPGANLYLNTGTAPPPDPNFMYLQQVENSAGQIPVTPAVPGSNISLKKSVSTSALQARQQQKTAKKEIKTVRCNLCLQMLKNDEESLLDHVQRMHGA